MKLDVTGSYRPYELEAASCDAPASQPSSCASRCVFRRAGPQERPSLEAFISRSFDRAYRARIVEFMPALWSLRRDGRLAAACGLRHAEGGRLFLERYLEAPVEALLAAACGQPVARSRVIEVGNLAVAHPGRARLLIRHLALHLHEAGAGWAVFTAVRALRNSFLRLGIPLLTLARAEPGRLDPVERPAWGTYYEMHPLVTAVEVRAAFDSVSGRPCAE